jgi:glycosyltransferase involved in cell wall biosynthesis
MSPYSVRRIAILGSYVPRQCGIATFTHDLAEAIALGGASVDAIAVTDLDNSYAYPSRVVRSIDQNDRLAYAQTAEWINRQGYDLLCVQHEYGLYGGEAGADLLELLREVDCPIVSTLHTLLEEPNDAQRAVMDELARLSDRLVVMSLKGAQILEQTHRVDPRKVMVIPHGIPIVTVKNACAAKARLGYAGRRLLLTFGLLSPDKGIEDVIRALPSVVKDFPDVTYLVVGATHPHIRATFGERYRDSLIALAHELGVDHHIVFENKYVDMDELTERLQAADIYITPYHKKQQVTSGTLAYAYGSGNAVVSTSYWHAEELLADGRGVLVPHKDPSAIADALTNLLDDDIRLKQIQARSFAEGRAMQWPQIGLRYREAFENAKEDRRLPQVAPAARPTLESQRPLLRHLLSLFDDVGIVQHCHESVPNRFEGYCLDDAVRALMVLDRVAQPDAQVRRAMNTALAYTHHAFDAESGRFWNFMSYDRQWIDVPYSSDAHGRAVWALGSIAGTRRGSWGQFADRLFRRSLDLVPRFDPTRSRAYALLGLVEHGKRGSDGSLTALRRRLAKSLHEDWKHAASRDWCWFEDFLSYDNARIPQALIEAGWLDGDDAMVMDGLSALDWLMDVQQSGDGAFRPIGCEGFFPRGGRPALFDQQPLEAWASVEACLTAYRVEPSNHWFQAAKRAHDWFFGGNDLGVSMVDFETGGSFDGLTPHGANMNQGAESAISLVGTMTSFSLTHQSTTDRQHSFVGIPFLAR